jgi:hypothetical protein
MLGELNDACAVTKQLVFNREVFPCDFGLGDSIGGIGLPRGGG